MAMTYGAAGFGKVFEKSTFIRWDYKMLQNRSRSASGYLNVQDPNQTLPVEWKNVFQPPFSGNGNAWYYSGRNESGENRALLEFTVGAPQGLKYSENRDFLEHIYDPRKVNKYFRVTFGPDWLDTVNDASALANGDLIVLPNLNYIIPANKGTLRQEDCESNFSGISPTSPINISIGWTWEDSYGGLPARHLPYARVYLSHSNLNHYAEDEVIIKAGDWFFHPNNRLIDTGNNEFTIQGDAGEWPGQVPYQAVNDVIILGSPGGGIRYLWDTSGDLPGPNGENDGPAADGAFFISRSSPPAADLWDTGTAIGSNVYFTMIPKKIPNYRILPHDIVEFEGDFVFQETGTKGI